MILGPRGLSLCALIVLLAVPAEAVIERLTPLKTFIDEADRLLVAKVERVDLAKSRAVLSTSGMIKGKMHTLRFPINIAGDTPGEDAKLLERLAPGLRVVLFITDKEDEKKQQVLAYINGTWFQMFGHGLEKDAPFGFTHFEPYLRRTFNGSTAELEAVLADVVAGKRKPPAANSKEKPGLGPKAELAAEPK